MRILATAAVLALVTTPALAQAPQAERDPAYSDAPVYSKFFHDKAAENGQVAEVPEEWIGQADVMDSLRNQGYRDVEGLSRSGDAYVAQATSPDGDRVRLRLSPFTGHVRAEY